MIQNLRRKRRGRKEKGNKQIVKLEAWDEEFMSTTNYDALIISQSSLQRINSVEDNSKFNTRCYRFGIKLISGQLTIFENFM